MLYFFLTPTSAAIIIAEALTPGIIIIVLTLTRGATMIVLTLTSCLVSLLF